MSKTRSTRQAACVGLFVALLFASPPLQAQTDWRKKAIETYPELGVPGSPLNAKFLELHNAKKGSDPSFLASPDWPMRLAAEAAAALPTPNAGVQPPIPKGVALAPDWATRKPSLSNDDKEIRASVREVLSPYGQPSTDTSAGPGGEFCPDGITYLMPLTEAVKKLNLGKPLQSRIDVPSPGFPEGLFYYTYQGQFDAREPGAPPYPKLQMVTDMKDQVVCIQLFTDNQHPLRMVMGIKDEFRLYDFVTPRINKRSGFYVQCFSLPEPLRKATNWIWLQSALCDPKGEKFHYRSLWYLPPQLVGLILHCCNK